MDGAVDWSIFCRRIFELDAANLKFRFLKRVPGAAIGWTKLNIRTNQGILALEMPKPDGSKGVILVDTGSPLGADLVWREWKATHTDQPTTLTANYNPESRWFVREQAWAKKLSVCPLELTDVV